MSADLQTLIDDALASVLADPDHHLLPDTRRAIYAALEPATKPPTVQQRRGRLAVLAARRVLPLWEQCIPIDEGLAEDDEYNIDRLPHDMLARAERALNSGTDNEQSWTYANDQWYVVGNISEEFYAAREYADEAQETRFHNAYFALTAALHALMETLGHEFLISKTWSIGADNQVHKPLWIDGSIPDREIDAAGAAMRAEAGADQPDPEKRLRFWNWWLTQAVPGVLRYAL